MNFWKSFSKKAVLKQLGFAIVIFAILIPLSFWDSGRQVKVTFDDNDIFVKSKKYSMRISYEEIVSAELAALAAPGEELTDSFDNDIVRTGMWQNDIWGEYYIIADLDTTNCVLLHLKDGRLFVVSQKDNTTTEEVFNTLMAKLE